jgi:ParB-like chromosome segregation protein Spo0J
MGAKEMNVRVNDEYARLVHALTEQEYGSLKSSIKESNGNIVAIIVNQESVILDGHHRFRACNELNITPKIEIKEFNNKLDEKKFVYEINLKRRHLSDFQKAELALGLEGIYSEEARARQLSNLKNVKLSLGPNEPNDKIQGRTSEMVSKQAGISATIYKRAKKIIETGSEEVKKRLRAGRSSISKEYNKIQIAERKTELTKEPQKIDLPEGCKLLQGDFEDLAKDIPDNSIDLILTDPPYRNEDLPLFEKLGLLANRVLKEGGSLVLFAGQYDLLLKGNTIEKSGLKFRWQFCVKHTGHQSKMRGFGTLINVAWKPLIWFIKGNGGRTSTPGWIEDFVESKPPKKDMHEWEQSTVEAEHVIKGLTVENQIILDPFMGYGTNGIAALGLNRKFIGIEIDKEHYSNAAQRLSKFAG